MDAHYYNIFTHISKWNTNNVTDMYCMFNGCSSLSSVPDIPKWNTNNTYNMQYMFDGYLNIIISNILISKFKL